MAKTSHSVIPVPLSPNSLPQKGESDDVSLRELPVKLYGINNCNTVKKARDYLAQMGIAFEFHDFKRLGLNEEIAQNWLQQRDWNELINRKGLTWRGLSDEYKQQVTDSSSALALMVDKTSAIKRPLLEQDGKLLYVGFDPAAYEEIFNVKVQND
jgi:Spx/MgsR family transcriptional regulator